MLSMSHNIGKVNKDFEKYAKNLKAATASALNKTAAQAFTAASKNVRDEYNIKAADLKAATKITKATANNPKAVIGAGGKRIRLIKFGGRQVKTGVSVMVKKAGGRKVVAHAFVRPLKSSGADTIYVRKGAERLPVESLLGPAPWQIFKGQDKFLKAFYDKNLGRILKHEVEYRTR